MASRLLYAGHRERLRGADAGGEVEFDAGLDVVLGDAVVPQAAGRCEVRCEQGVSPGSGGLRRQSRSAG